MCTFPREPVCVCAPTHARARSLSLTHTHSHTHAQTHTHTDTHTGSGTPPCLPHSSRNPSLPPPTLPHNDVEGMRTHRVYLDRSHGALNSSKKKLHTVYSTGVRDAYLSFFCPFFCFFLSLPAYLDRSPGTLNCHDILEAHPKVFALN